MFEHSTDSKTFTQYEILLNIFAWKKYCNQFNTVAEICENIKPIAANQPAYDGGKVVTFRRQ